MRDPLAAPELTDESGFGYAGERAPSRFNMARYCVGEAAASAPERTALIVVADPDAHPDQAERWTFGQLDDAVRAVAAGLLARGVCPGDRVLLRLGNTSDYPLVFFGAIAAGIVALPSSAMLTAEEVAFLAADSRAVAVAANDDTAFPEGPRLRIGPEDVRGWIDSSDRADYADTDAEEPAFLVYTSGTTDRPKGVLHAQRSAWGRRPMYDGWYGIEPGDVMLHAGAFNWTYTLGVGLTDPWANAATAVVYNGPKDPGIWPRLIEAYGATLFAAVPGVYRQMLDHSDLEETGGPGLATLRHGLVAGEALQPALLQRWRAATGKDLYEALGMSECSTFISSGPHCPVRPGSPGRPQPGRCIVALPVDGGETPVAVGETGVLAIHRTDPGLMLGYWERPEEEAESLRGDWFVSADLVSFDEDGYVGYHGRADDVMNAGGYRVSPQEVEHCLAHHPAVADVAVTEVEVREGVTVIGAFVVLRGEGDPTDAALAEATGDVPDEAALRSYAGEHLAAYKVPRTVTFVDKLPRTANGKIMRRSLRETS